MRTYKIRTMYLALFILLVKRSTSESRHYAAKIVLDDKSLQENPLPEYDVHSLIMCSAMCGPGCTNFGVNLQRKKCRIYNGRHSTNSALPEVGWRYYFQDSGEKIHLIDCKHLLAVGFSVSSVYTIYPWYNRSVDVFCDMKRKDGGWTVKHRRIDGSTDFLRNWNEYKEGFGSVNSSYWIGNDVIHQLTKISSSLYVSITLTNGTTLYQQYEEFSVTDEKDNYRLYLAGPTEGTLGDSMLDVGDPYLNLSGMSFTTYDRDNDEHNDNCAIVYDGGWWFNYCHTAFLNGPWCDPGWYKPLWPTVIDGSEIKETVMMIKTR